MKLKLVFRLAVLLVAAAPDGARAAVREEFFKTGGKLELKPEVTATITNILWKHQGNLVAEWVKDVVELTYYDTFKDRTTLDTGTGQLRITNMVPGDAGTYTLEINSKVHADSYQAKELQEVPKATAYVRPVSCSLTSQNCTLICDALTDTAKAEPIRYSWKLDKGDWSIFQKEVPIDKSTSGTEFFTCRMENPVSMKESQAIKNPFYKPPVPVGVIVGGVFAVAAVCAAIVGYIKRDVIMAKFRSGAPDNGPNTNGESKPDHVTTEYHAVDNKTEDGEHTTETA